MPMKTLVFLGILGLASVLPGLGQAACVTARAADIEAAVLAQINSLRAGAGAAPLRADAALAQIAQAHACDNAARNSYSHTGSDGSTLADRLARDSYRYANAAENTGLGHATVAAVVEFWNRSPGHRKNLVNPDLTRAGLGLWQTTGGRNVWVLLQTGR